jgi:hypothetical protein
MARTPRFNASSGTPSTPRLERLIAGVAQLQLRRLTTCGFCRQSMRVGLVMRRFVVWALLFCLVAPFGGCKSSTVSEAALEPPPQTKPRDARLARLYFLREKGLPGAEVGIKVDGKPVGSITKGFYFFSEKPPGRYRIACVNPIMMDYESEIEIEAGKTYYFGVGTPQVAAPGQNLLNQALAGSSGEQMRPTSPLMAGFSGAALYQIDAAEGAAVISQLKPQ